ncbi:glycosyltransferase family 32 protein [Chitinophaga filiformis]|uniref:Glycosyltransferase sugar-binding region containing DXD motif-containing protein n=1 Tax=Chitinophaga filiformis TaxID=104663 RepID=A0A1G7LR17_CHIFI|nr:glycosyltransferase [Chitinophaga filiformis]SDF51957.1 Glycosyltransferase sugar-binding region containing DXD motif-containing protein [Chitinophaga filiformis]
MVTQLLHQIVGPKTNPLIDQCLSSWKVIKDYGFEIRTWNDDTLEEFIDTHYSWALQAFRNARNHAEAADIARYLLVHHSGGIYMDWDVELLIPEQFFTLLERTPQGFLVIDPANGTLASEAFSAEKNEAYLLDLVTDIVHLYNSNERDNMGTPQYSGPFRMRDSLVNSCTAQLLLPVKEVFAYDYTEIREMPDREISQPLIHYWIHSWI